MVALLTMELGMIGSSSRAAATVQLLSPAPIRPRFESEPLSLLWRWQGEADAEPPGQGEGQARLRGLPGGEAGRPCILTQPSHTECFLVHDAPTTLDCRDSESSLASDLTCHLLGPWLRVGVGQSLFFNIQTAQRTDVRKLFRDVSGTHAVSVQGTTSSHVTFATATATQRPLRKRCRPVP